MTPRTTPKTAYEIRLELLQLAFDVLVKKHEAAAVASYDKFSNEFLGARTSPTTEEVIAEAEKMNTFVSKANQNH